MSGSRFYGSFLASVVNLSTLSFGVHKRRRILLQVDSRIQDHLIRPEFYEAETIEWLHGLSDGSHVLWDIGANIGAYSLYAAKRFDCQVIAFEPAAASYEALNKNIRASGLENRITALPVALCATTKIDHLNMGSFDAGSAMHGFGVHVDQFGSAITTKFRQGAVGFSIDDFVRIFRPPLPGYIKIDVDGLEPEIIRGGRETLSAPNVRSVIMEMEGSEARLSELFELMASLGFVARAKRKDEHRNVAFDRR